MIRCTGVPSNFLRKQKKKLLNILINGAIAPKPLLMVLSLFFVLFYKEKKYV